MLGWAVLSGHEQVHGARAVQPHRRLEVGLGAGRARWPGYQSCHSPNGGVQLKAPFGNQQPGWVWWKPGSDGDPHSGAQRKEEAGWGHGSGKGEGL